MKRLFKQIYGKKLESFEEVKFSLPLYLQDGRRFYRISVAGITFVIVFIVTKERFNIQTLKKQLITYRNAIKELVVYGFERITFFQRTSLIENDVPFASCNGQMYLPFMGVYFEKCAMNEDIIPERFTPISQLLFLLFLYEKDSYSKLEAAKGLNVLPMAISRASKQLLETGLIVERKQGTEVIMTISIKDRKELYERAVNYLINPIQDVVYLPDESVEGDAPASGEYGLSQRSDLGYPRYVEYALYKNLDYVKEFTGVDPDLSSDNNLVRVQKWKYDPSLFARNGQVDPVSLICSFVGTKDERIHKCLEQVKEEIREWRIIKS